MQFSKIIFTVACFMATMVSAQDTNTTGTCTDPSDQLVPLFAVDGPDFANICIAANITSDTTVVSSFTSCCGSQPVTNIGDGCYTYCNITVGAPQTQWLSCFQDAAGVTSDTMFACFNGTEANLTAVSFTSTPTEAATTNTATATASVPASTTSAGASHVTSSTSKTATGTGSASASASATKASMAGHAAGVSTVAFMAIGLVLVGHFLA